MHIGLDFFDASINRIAEWVIGTRNMKKALLRALLEPTAELRKLEAAGDYTARLALLKGRNRCRGRQYGKCIANVMIRQQVANGWRACGHMRKRF